MNSACERQRTKRRMAKFRTLPSNLQKSVAWTALAGIRADAKLAPPSAGCTIFDWDDTLFPTWYLKNVVCPCQPGCTLYDGTKPPESMFSAVLAAHTKAVRDVLQAAAKSGQVAIVTMGARPWVYTSAQRWLPDLHLPELLCELGIQVFYAREHLKGSLLRRVLAESDEGVNHNPGTVAKRAAMSKCLRKLYKGSSLPWNVLSIGDSPDEHDALTELLWSNNRKRASPLCKTVKLTSDPTVAQLTSQLELLSTWLPSMVAHGHDFDLNLQELGDDPGEHLGETEGITE